jgi:hypothetical protein
MVSLREIASVGRTARNAVLLSLVMTFIPNSIHMLYENQPNDLSEQDFAS